MKNLFLCLCVAIAALLFAPVNSFAATTNTLLSQDFSGSFPPAGWSANLLWYGSYYSQPGWTHSSGGATGSDGSAVAWTMWGRSYRCSGSSYGPLTLTAPTVSGYPATDSQYLDFDLYMPRNYYESFYSQMGISFKVLDGTTTVLSLKTGDAQASDATWYDTQYGFSDPSGRTGSGYWRHYHVKLPGGVSSHTVQFLIEMLYGSCYYSYWYTDDIAIDNVVITSVHYNVLTLNGPPAINFGNVPALQTAGPYYTHITDSGSLPISLTGYNFTGSNPGDFAVTYMPSTIQPGTTDSIGITYTPRSGGARCARLNVSTDADIPPTFSIALSGIGLVPKVSYSATTMFRGVQTELDSGSHPTYLYVNSTGGIPLVVDSAYVIGLNPNAYVISSLPSTPIPPGKTDSIGVQFTPDIEGLPDAHIVIVSNAINNPSDTVMMSGIGVLPHLMINPTVASQQISNINHSLVVNFDSVRLGTDTCMQVFLTNPGSDTLAIEQSYLSGRDFDFTLTPLTAADTLIPPGSSRMMQVCFAPLQRGYRTATVTLQTNIPLTHTTPPQDTSKFFVQFIGTGVPTGQLYVNGPSTNGNSTVGQQACATDTFWNTGGADITVTGVTIGGVNATVFNASGYPALPFTLAANSSKTFSVCATPSDTGTQVALLTAVGTSGSTPVTGSLALKVYGTLVKDSIAAMAPTLTCVGESDTILVTVMNTGNVPTTYQGSVAGGTNPNDFKIVGSTTSGMINGGGSATFTVVFTPTTNTNETTNFNVVGGGNGALLLTAAGGAAAITGDNKPVPTFFPTDPVQTLTVNVKNTGTCDWTPGTPGALQHFTYSGGGTTAIAAGGTGTLTFTFDPSVGIGSYSENVTFPSPTGMSIPSASVTVAANVTADKVPQVTASNGFVLGQSYPNPIANGVTESQVEITVPTSAMVHLAVLDVKGAVVEKILDRQFDAGTYEVSLDASSLSSGTYYYQLTAEGVVLTRQMTVVK